MVTALDVQPQIFNHFFEVFGQVKADKSINLYTSQRQGEEDSREKRSAGEKGSIATLSRHGHYVFAARAADGFGVGKNRF